MTPLAQLIDALRSGGALGWLLVHAPDGDADAAVRRAWEGEPCVWGLMALVIRTWGLYRLAQSVQCIQACKGDGPYSRHSCAPCCAAIRAECPTPTWSELTRAA